MGGKETRRLLESMGGDGVVRMGLYVLDWAGQVGRVLVIGSRRNAEHKSDVKKKKRGSSVYRLIMQLVVFSFGTCTSEGLKPAGQ